MILFGKNWSVFLEGEIILRFVRKIVLYFKKVDKNKMSYKAGGRGRGEHRV
jgi:hypothetical protein